MTADAERPKHADTANSHGNDETNDRTAGEATA